MVDKLISALSAPSSVKLIDDPYAPEFFADDVAGFFIYQGTVRIVFESARVNPCASPRSGNRVVVGRVVMSADAAQRLAAGLCDFLRNGRTPTQPPG